MRKSASYLRKLDELKAKDPFLAMHMDKAGVSQKDINGVLSFIGYAEKRGRGWEDAVGVLGEGLRDGAFKPAMIGPFTDALKEHMEVGDEAGPIMRSVVLGLKSGGIKRDDAVKHAEVLGRLFRGDWKKEEYRGGDTGEVPGLLWKIDDKVGEGLDHHGIAAMDPALHHLRRLKLRPAYVLNSVSEGLKSGGIKKENAAKVADLIASRLELGISRPSGREGANDLGNFIEAGFTSGVLDDANLKRAIPHLEAAVAATHKSRWHDAYSQVMQETLLHGALKPEQLEEAGKKLNKTLKVVEEHGFHGDNIGRMFAEAAVAGGQSMEGYKNMLSLLRTCAREKKDPFGLASGMDAQLGHGGEGPSIYAPLDDEHLRFMTPILKKHITEGGDPTGVMLLLRRLSGSGISEPHEWPLVLKHLEKHTAHGQDELAQSFIETRKNGVPVQDILRYQEAFLKKGHFPTANSVVDYHDRFGGGRHKG